MADSIVSRMNEQQKFLVFGFVRGIEKEYKNIRIPEPIVLLFALYYVANAEWDLSLKSADIMVSGDNNEFVENMTASQYSWKSIFGKRICCGYGKYEWNLKIISTTKQVSNSWKIMVGIIENKYCSQQTEDSAFDDKWGIGLVGSTQGITQTSIVNSDYGELFEKVGDTVKIILDLDNLTLSYVINGTDYGAAIDANNSYKFELNKHDEYRLALSIIKGRKLRLFNPF